MCMKIRSYFLKIFMSKEFRILAYTANLDDLKPKSILPSIRQQNYKLLARELAFLFLPLMGNLTAFHFHLCKKSDGKECQNIGLIDSDTWME